MKLLFQIDELHLQARQNKWLAIFALFNRVTLAAGFIPAGIVKIMGHRFADGLSVIHPMGHYLEALHFTDYYYTFIGVVQVLAGILLLIPRTVTIGALLYFPIILNICILSFALRFDGSLLTSPLMTLGCLYLLCWNYDRLKYILPYKSSVFQNGLAEIKATSWRFPVKFFFGVIVTIAMVIGAVFTMNKYAIMPRNTLKFCNNQFKNTNNIKEGNEFCECIHIEGNALKDCLKKYKKSIN